MKKYFTLQDGWGDWAVDVWPNYNGWRGRWVVIFRCPWWVVSFDSFQSHFT